MSYTLSPLASRYNLFDELWKDKNKGTDRSYLLII